MSKNLIISDYKNIFLWILFIGFTSTVFYWIFKSEFFVYLGLFVFLVLLINVVLSLFRIFFENIALKDKIYFLILVLSSVVLYCINLFIDYKIFCNSMTE